MSSELFNEMMEDVYEVNVANGWFDADRTFGDGIALLHSEVSEALEAYREWGTQPMAKVTWRGGKSQVWPREDVTRDVNIRAVKPEGVGSEYADVLIRLLDSCHRDGIDLYAEYERKLEYNRGRGYRHGGKAL